MVVTLLVVPISIKLAATVDPTFIFLPVPDVRVISPVVAEVAVNARGVLCSSSVGKLYGRCLRNAAVPALVAETQGAQFGAVPGGGTDLPSVAIQLFLDGAARRGKTVAVLFTDITGAFYRILPEIALAARRPAAA